MDGTFFEAATSMKQKLQTVNDFRRMLGFWFMTSSSRLAAGHSPYKRGKNLPCL